MTQSTVARLAEVLAPVGCCPVTTQRLAAVLSRPRRQGPHGLSSPDGGWGADDPVPHHFDSDGSSRSSAQQVSTS
jgi:hypothetical protein